MTTQALSLDTIMGVRTCLTQGIERALALARKPEMTLDERGVLVCAEARFQQAHALLHTPTSPRIAQAIRLLDTNIQELANLRCAIDASSFGSLPGAEVGAIRELARDARGPLTVLV